MPFILKKIHITNFKSFKNLTVSLDRFNVVIGPNASGKTNFVEFFKFLKKALVERRRPYMPLIEWWSYHNVVWRGQDELPIGVEMDCEIDGFDIKYEVTFGAIAGTMRILSERLEIVNYLSLEREGQSLRIKHNEVFLKDNTAEIEKMLVSFSRFFEAELGKQRIELKSLVNQTMNVSDAFTNLLNLESMELPVSQRKLSISMIERRFARQEPEKDTVRLAGGIAIMPRKRVKGSEDYEYMDPLSALLINFRRAINGFTVVKHPNMQGMKTPSSPQETNVLFEDGTNLNNILSNWISEKQKLPNRIEAAITELFPNTQVGATTTAQGEVFVKVYEKGLELNPPCIADGLYKILAVLAAIELKPSLLAIDEIENSLHAKALRYIIDELRASGTTVVLTTHSPVVVDMVKLEDLLIAEKTSEGTTLTKIREPEKLRDKLAELNVTPSEGWLYGGLKS